MSFQAILKRTPDIFEAVVGLGQRALQINARRAAERQVLEEDYFEDEYPLEEPVENPDYVEEDKSTGMAMEAFLDTRLSWNYPQEEKAYGKAKPVNTTSPDWPDLPQMQRATPARCLPHCPESAQRQATGQSAQTDFVV